MLGLFQTSRRGQRVIAPDALDAGSAGLVSVSRQLNASICALAEQVGKHCCGGTGGLARLIEPESETIDEVDEYLTLDGLRLLYELNR